MFSCNKLAQGRLGDMIRPVPVQVKGKRHRSDSVQKSMPYCFFALTIAVKSPRVSIRDSLCKEPPRLFPLCAHADAKVRLKITFLPTRPFCKSA